MHGGLHLENMMSEQFWTVSVHKQKADSPTIGLELGLFEELCRLFPHYSRAGGKYLEITTVPEGDPGLLDFLSKVQNLGIKLPVDRSEVSAGISLYHLRGIAPSLVNEAPLLEPWCEGAQLADTQWIERGVPYVLFNECLRKKKDHQWGRAASWSTMLLVRGEMMEKISRANLVGLSFRPLSLGNKNFWEGFKAIPEWPKGVEPLYQIWSTIELPPIRNWLFDNKGRVFSSTGNRGPFPDGCLYLEEFYSQPQLHYRRPEIASLGEFDIAHTYERFGSKDHVAHPTLLVSQRFRAVLEEAGCKRMKYFPHCIDDDPWMLGVDGPVHPRLSGPFPAQPIEASLK